MSISKQQYFSYLSLKSPPRTSNISSEEIQNEISKAQNCMNHSIFIGNYTDAEKYSEKIDQLNFLLNKKRTNEIQYRHLIEKQNLLSNKYNDIENLNLLYDQKFEELQIRSQATLEELKTNQEKELQEFYNLYQNEILNFKPSSLFLKLQKEEEGLVKLRKFKEAEIVRKKKERQAENDFNKLNKNRENTFKCLEKI